MSYVPPAELFKRFPAQERTEWESRDVGTKSQVLNYKHLAAYELNTLSGHLIAPLLGEAKPNKQVNHQSALISVFNHHSYVYVYSPLFCLHCVSLHANHNRHVTVRLISILYIYRYPFRTTRSPKHSSRLVYAI